jgi:hypothetical protein
MDTDAKQGGEDREVGGQAGDAGQARRSEHGRVEHRHPDPLGQYARAEDGDAQADWTDEHG